MNQYLNNKEIQSYLSEFIEIFEKRPIKDNKGGMGFNHSFGLFVILKSLGVKNIYESGIWKGNSTWIIENSLTDFKLTAIDIDLSLREYISSSKNVFYFEGDIEELSFVNEDVSNTIVFFDDHTNVIERLKFLYSWGIKYAIFEDNYPVGQGDAYSIRKIINKSGQTINEWFPDYKEPRNRFSSYKQINKLYKRFIMQNDSLPYFLNKYYYFQKKIKRPNDGDADLFYRLVKNYYEIQPVYRYDTQRWNSTEWAGNYESLEPVFKTLEGNEFTNKLKMFEKESPKSMFDYTYISFVELNVK